MNTTLKNYLVSSGITFATALFISIGSQLTLGAVTAENLTVSALIGVLYVAVRAAIKATVSITAVVIKGITKTIGSTKKAVSKRK